jgi:riboflavin biosynthesis pyrimidine reductase
VRGHEIKAQSSRDIAIGDPNLAAHAIRAGLVDEYHLFLAPIMVGGGNAFFPPNG